MYLYSIVFGAYAQVERGFAEYNQFPLSELYNQFPLSELYNQFPLSELYAIKGGKSVGKYMLFIVYFLSELYRRH